MLLADGNIGIGGDPARLLRRVRELLAVGGRVVADVHPRGGVRPGRHWLSAYHPDGYHTGGPLGWASVGADAVATLGRESGLTPGRVTVDAGRAVATWHRGR